MHDVQPVQDAVGAGEQHGNDREVLGDVVGDRERRERPSRDEELLADLDDVDELRRVGVEVDHVPGLLGGRGPGVHRHADIGLREGGRVVRPVAGHRDELAVLLLGADEGHLALRGRLGEVVVDARLGGDRGRGERVVAGDHDGPDPHRPHRREPLLDAFLDDVLQLDDTDDGRTVGDDERRRTGAGHPFDDAVELRRNAPALAGDPLPDRVGGTLADLAAPDIQPGHAGEGGEGDELVAAEGLAADVEAVLGEHDDRAAFRRLVGERGELCRLGDLALVMPPDRRERGGHPVAECDGAGLVQQQRLDVAGGFDRPPAHREDVALHEPVHARDTDGGQQRADRRRDETDEQRDEDDHLDGVARVVARRAGGRRRRAGR